MKPKNMILTVVMALLAPVALAKANPKALDLEIEKQNQKSLEAYSQQTGKPVPEVVDYRYGMKLDVAKLIYTSRPVIYCGVVSKIMSFEDSQGKPQSVRYRDQGECRTRH